MKAGEFVLGLRVAPLGGGPEPSGGLVVVGAGAASVPEHEARLALGGGVSLGARDSVPVECVPVGCGASEPHAAESGEVGGRACAAQIGGFLKELRAFGGIRVQPLAAQHDDAEQVKGLGELSGGGLPEERERTAVLAAVGRVGEKAAGEFGLCGGIAAAGVLLEADELGHRLLAREGSAPHDAAEQVEHVVLGLFRGGNRKARVGTLGHAEVRRALFGLSGLDGERLHYHLVGPFGHAQDDALTFGTLGAGEHLVEARELDGHRD